MMIAKRYIIHPHLSLLDTSNEFIIRHQRIENELFTLKSPAASTVFFCFLTAQDDLSFRFEIMKQFSRQ